MNSASESEKMWKFKIFMLLTIMLGTFISPIQCACKVVINEVNIIDSKYFETNDYVELKQTCMKQNEISLKGYKLIGFSCKLRSGIIDTVATLWNFSMNKNGLFTIGGAKVATADVNLPHVMVKTQSSFSTIKMHTMTNFLANAQADIRGIGLLYDKDNSFADITLTNKDKVLPINDKITKILEKYLIDLVVYAGEKGTCNKCDLIERIHRDYGERKYVLREVRVNLKNNDISLNRCAIENEGFLPEMFKLGNPTPGAENDCTGPHFILEDNISEMEAALNFRTSYMDDSDDTFQSCSSQPQTQPGCISSIPQSDYSQITSYSIAKSIEQLNDSSTTNDCTSLFLSPDGDRDITIIEQANKRKKSIGEDTDYSDDHEWTTTKYFK